MKAKHRYLITTIKAEDFINDVDKRKIGVRAKEGAEMYLLDLQMTNKYIADANKKTIPDNILFSQLLREKLRRICVQRNLIIDDENADDEMIDKLQTLVYTIYSADTGTEVFDSKLFLSISAEHDACRGLIANAKREHIIKRIESAAKQGGYFADAARQQQATEVLLDLVREGYDELFARDIIFLNLDKVKNELPKDTKKSKICRNLFQNGFSMTFQSYSNPKETEVVDYVRFEKSNSMSKNSTIAFIRSDLKEAMERRITLGLKLHKCYISKFHAYKGLCFSSGVRVDSGSLPMAEFKNEKDAQVLVPHIIVVNDIAHTASGVECKSLDECKKAEGSDNKDRIETVWKLTEKKIEDNRTVILSDGAGFISKEYASKLAKKINADGEQEATSFQFRIPFGKGVLHSVDFHEFFKEKVHGTKIKDAFGCEHDINDVQIILTRSQFKAFSWFVGFAERNGIEKNKIWEYYLTRFLNYGHAFYVVNTSPADENKPMVTKLNYQILHTLPINADGFQAIVDDSIDNYRLLKKDLNAQLVEYLSLSEKIKENDYINYDENEGEKEHEDLLARETEVTRSGSQAVRKDKPSPIESILEKEPRLIGVPYFRAQLRDIANSKRRDYMMGRLLIKGRLKMMAPDLLYLLYRIARDNCCCYDEGASAAGLKNWWLGKDGVFEHLHEHSFYSPVGEFEDGKEYALFRNPHISRNEHTVAQAFVPSPQSLREKYFGHLQGVAMINPCGLIQERLQGADYDGDIMRIIDNEHYVSAAKKASELPLLLMPEVKSQEKEITPENEWETVIATFTNRVGQVSNCAFTNAVNAYNENAVSETEATNKSAEVVEKLALLTGLEIDSAKNGSRPYIPLDELQVSDNRYFIDLKNLIKKNEYKQKELEEMIRPAQEGAANINNLPHMVYNATDIKARKSSRMVENSIFRFDGIEKEAETARRMASLIAAYVNVIKNIGSASYASKRSQVDYHDAIIKTLRRQHDETSTHNLYELLAALFASCSNYPTLVSLYNDAVSHRWIFSRRENRRGLLREILSKVNVTPDDVVSDALCNFRNKGYDLLAYTIQHRLAEINMESIDAIDETPKQKAQRKLESWRDRLRSDLAQHADLASYENDGIDALFEEFCAGYRQISRQMSKEIGRALKSKDIQEALRLMRDGGLLDGIRAIMSDRGDEVRVELVASICGYAKARCEYEGLIESDGETDAELVQEYMKQMTGFTRNREIWIERASIGLDLLTKEINKELEKRDHFDLVYSDSPAFLKKEYAKNCFRQLALEICGKDEKLVVFYFMQTKGNSPAREYIWEIFSGGINNIVENNPMLDLPTHADDGSMTYEFENFRVCAAMDEEFEDVFEYEYDSDEDFSFI